MELIDTLSLREKKFAMTKLMILDKFISLIKNKEFNDISVKEVSKYLDISEKTIFNYFSSKDEIIIYFIQLWYIEMSLLSSNNECKSNIKCILNIFLSTAKLIQNNYNLMAHIISLHALSNKEVQKNIAITRAEMIIKFKTSTLLPKGGFKEIIMSLLKKAYNNQELKLNEDISLTYIKLHNIFYGTPIFLNRSNIDRLPDLYNKLVNEVLN